MSLPQARLDVAMVDPSLFTLPYDLALCNALAERNCGIALYGRKLRPLEVVQPATGLSAAFYGFSERLRGRVPNRIFHAVKGLEHAGDMARLYSRFLRDRPSIVHFQWSPLPTIDSFFIRHIRRKVGPVVMTAHDVTPFNNSPTSALQRIGSTGILREVDHLIVHSESSKVLLAQRGLEASRISVVAHGVLGVAEGRTDRANPAGPLTILSFGRIKTYKGVDLIIEALGRLPPTIRDRCRLLVVGEPMIPIEPLRARAEALGVAGSVVWDLRYVSETEMADVFACADIFAFPYREIDTSGVLMSCLRFGKPIIASAIGAFPKLLTDNVHGRIVPPEDPASLADAIGSLVTDPDARKRYGQNVANLACHVPSWDAIAKQTIEIYRRLLASRINGNVSSRAETLAAV